MTNILDTEKISREFLVFLRNSDILSTTVRGVTRVTNQFNGNGTNKNFTLTNTNIKNVKTVIVGTTTLDYGYDYEVNYNTGVVSLVVAPEIGTDNVKITYDHGVGDKIYPDFPRQDISISSYPRIGFDIISIDTVDIGFGNAMTSDVDIQVNLYSVSRNDLKSYGNILRTALINNRNSFFYLNHLIPIGNGLDLPNIAEENKVFMRVVNIRSILNYEVN